MSDLAGFLLARIAEDEVRARDARGYQTGSRYEGQPFDWQLHMERWSPGRVLAECEAKRRIVAMHEISGEAEEAWHVDASGKEVYGPTGHVVFGCSKCDQAQGNDENWYTDRRSRIPGCTTLRVLALPYADHPDYREEWRP